MKKRIVCVLLTLIMLVSLVPAGALTASAATKNISEAAITVLKQLEGYSKTCDENGYIGYGTKCTKDGDHGGTHTMYEKTADTALRAVLKDLDEAVDSFVSKNGLNLSQSQHDALVLFSFQNGTSWTIGTGEFQTAIKSGATGNKFLNAICWWNNSPADDYRRMMEANMYLNGVYSSSRPSRFIRVHFNAGAEGWMNEAEYQYFDVASAQYITLQPTPMDKTNIFLGWYTNEGERVDVLTASSHDLDLEARWQNEDAEYEDGAEVKYTVSKSALKSTTVYFEPNGEKKTKYVNKVDKEVTIKLADELDVVKDYLDSKGVLWACIVDEDGCEIGWVKLKTGSNPTTESDGTLAMDINVTVTNSYVNMRKNASITSTKNGTFNQGDVLRIIDVKNGSDGFLWGQVAASESDATPIGWVALMYTNYDSVKNASGSASSNNNTTVIATATITYTGYVNVRSEAGTNNQIVGALAQGLVVDVYETKFVNGVRWGRCSTGWFCMTYADVTWLVDAGSDNAIADVGFTNYVFSAKLIGFVAEETYVEDHFYKEPAGDEMVEPDYKLDKNGKKIVGEDGEYERNPMKSDALTISNLYQAGDETWGKTSYGWIKISDETGESDAVILDPAKFYVIAETLTIRDNPSAAANRIDVMVKGTEFDITKIRLIGETIWGYADKVGETDLTYYGWVNLSNANVSRNGAPQTSVGGSASTTPTTVKMARVVGTDSLRVRVTGATYGKQIGTLSYGTTAVILEENNGWYNLDIDVDNDPSTGSWVSGSYLEIYDETIGGTTSGGSTSGKVETGMGIVANTYTGVNIRSGAGTGNAIVGKYLTGTSVEILEVTTHGASKWGRTDKGWVCMDYITMVSNYVPTGSGSASGTGTGTVGGSTSSTTTEVAIYTGCTINDVSIFKSPSTKSDPVRENVGEGYPVTVHELLVVEEKTTEEIEDDQGGFTTVTTTENTYWARVNEGYIEAPGENIELYALDEHTYTVTEVAEMSVYNTYDDSRYEIFDLNKGYQVKVTSLQIYNGKIYGFVECGEDEDWATGWARLSDMTKGAVTIGSSTEGNTNTGSGNTTTGNGTTTQQPIIGSTGNTTTGGYVTNTSGYKYTGKVINTNQVNVRAFASTTANITTTLNNGAALVIYETTISENMAWGRCDAGWVYLYYVDLTPAVAGFVDARVVYNDNTIVYTDMNCSSVAGTYSRMSVIDIYEIVGKMARTDMGWVHTDNLL